MASIGVLGSLMSQLGAHQVPQYDPQQVALMQQRLQAGRMGNETALLQLQDLQRQQESAAAARAYYQQHPEELLGQQPTSTLGALGPAGGGPAPMTQQPMMPGQPPGAPQVVPGGQDLSRYAGVSPQSGGPIPPDVAAQVTPTVTPPQSTLGALSPPQAPPRNPLMDLMRRNPDAAMQVLDLQAKRQEQQFKMRGTVAEGIAVELQGATDQASYDAARQRVAQISPQWAQALPQVYSKDAVQPWIDRALSAKEKATLDVTQMQTQVDAVKAQADLARARMSGRVAKTDQYLKALGVAPGQETAEDMQKALAWQQKDEIAVSASHGSGQVVQTPDGMFRLRPGTDTVVPLYTPEGKALQPKPTQAETETATFSNLARQGNAGATALEQKGFTPGFWAKTADTLPFHIGNYLTPDQHQEYKGYVMDFAQAWLRRTSKGAITEPEWKLVDERYFPQPGNSKAEIERKRQAREQVIKELEAEGKGTGRTGTQAPPTSQGSRKPVGEMSREDIAAEIAAIKKRGGS